MLNFTSAEMYDDTKFDNKTSRNTPNTGIEGNTTIILCIYLTEEDKQKEYQPVCIQLKKRSQSNRQGIRKGD